MKHHEYASLFPMMGEAEIASLAVDIKEHGQHQPIITLHGEILDGRNRYAACEIAKVEPHLEAYQGDDALGFVVSSNLHRRHLNESQRAMIASRLATMKRGARPDLTPIGAKSLDEAAVALGVGTTSVDRARRVERDGAKELVAAVDRGEVKLGTAEKIIALPKSEQREIVAAGPERVRERAAEIRNGASASPTPPKQSERLPKYQPTDSLEIWQQAKLVLERILPTDKHRVKVLNEVINYCQQRLTNNK